MKYGFIIPHGDVHTITELAERVEAAGWDAVFIPDSISIETEQYPASEGFDPWIVLAVIADRTQRIRLGTMVTPLSRRRPWKIARETVTLDHLSKGRLILPVGLGAARDDAGFYKVGEAMDSKTRAKLLDESLEIITGLWSGKPVYYEGEHYHIQGMTLLPSPVQSPRIPIWVVGAWPRIKSMQRTLRYDGLLPNKLDANGKIEEISPDDIRAMKKYVEEHRSSTTPFDIVWEGRTPGEDLEKSIAIVRRWEEAGINWWMEAMWESDVTREDVRRRIEQGPPRDRRA